MGDQLELFEAPRVPPPGFDYQRELISPAAQRDLLEQIRGLPFRDFEFHGHVGKRRTVSFGWSYDFAHEQLRRAEEIPRFLLRLRQTAAAFAHLAERDFTLVLVSEYCPGAGIGWHRDKGVFGEVIGLSLAAACQFRLRKENGGHWERVTLTLEPGSAYLLSGPVRTDWEHSIPPVDELCYSITFRSLRRPFS